MSDFAGRGFGSPRRGGPSGPYGSPAGNRGTYVGGDSFESPVRGRGGYGSPRGGGRGSPYGSPYGGSPGRGGYGSNEPMPVPAQHDNLVQQKLAHGSEGRPVELIANFFKFTTTDVTVYHYDVDVKKDPKDFGKLALESAFPDAKKDTRSEEMSAKSSANLEKFIMKFSPLIVNKLISQRPDIFDGVKFVYDGHKNLYTVQKLDFSKYKFSDFNDTVQIDVDNRPVDFVAKLKLVEQVDVAQLLDYYSGKRQDLPTGRAISMYEIVFRFVMAQAHEPFQRKFYDLSTAQNVPRMQNVDFVQGYSSAVRATEFGLALNIHSRTSCLASKSLAKLTDLASYLANINPSKRPSRLQLLDVNKFARNLKIYTVHSNRTVKYGMDGLVDMFPSEVEFMHQGEKVSIESYFKKVYNLELQKLPLARTTGKHSRYLPMELCYLSPNQFLPNNKLNAAIQRELLLKSTHTPNALFSRLDSIAKKVAQTETKIQEKFGIKLDPRPIALKGRVLPTPKQLCPNNREKFYSTKETPKRWAVFCLDQTVSVEQLKAFVGQLKERAHFFGLNFGEPSPVVCMEIPDMKTMVNAFTNLYTKSQAEFVFVGIPSRNNAMAPPHMYATVKHLCEQRFGIMSQCFSVDKLLQTPVGYFDNFLLKTNGKLGGLNALVDPSQYKDLPFTMAKTMMIGIDVNHPADTEHLASSVSVAVGSLDAFYSKYTASIRLQKKDTDEILKHLDTMIKELLIEFFKTNYRHPDNLIIFRDGVSEGQFDKITKTELPLIQAGINSVGMPTKITLIVNQKHHNTRFALAQVNTNGRKPTWNVPSGTVVDSTIVEPTRKTFYLNSHFSPLGTSRPTKYVILRDDLNMTADQVQRMTFLACYNSIRTRGVLAIPTPTRYADLCAYRSKLLVEAQLRDSSDLGVTHTGKFEVESEMIKKLNEMVKVNDKLKDRLYYC